MVFASRATCADAAARGASRAGCALAAWVVLGCALASVAGSLEGWVEQADKASIANATPQWARLLFMAVLRLDLVAKLCAKLHLCKTIPVTKRTLAEQHRKMLQVLQQFRIVFKSIRLHYQEVER